MGFFSKSKKDKAPKEGTDSDAKGKGKEVKEEHKGKKEKKIKASISFGKDKKSAKKETFASEVLVSDVEYIAEPFKLCLAQKFRTINHSTTLKGGYTIEVSQFFSEGEKLPTLPGAANEHGPDGVAEEEEPVLASESRDYQIQFDVPGEVIEKARARQEKSEYFEKIHNGDLDYFKALDLKDKAVLEEMRKRGTLGNTLLHVAVKKANKELVAFLIDSKIIEVNERNDFGNTPLIELATMRKPLEESEGILEYLLEKGSDTTLTNKSNKTALESANDDRLRLLLEKHEELRGNGGAKTNSSLDLMFAANEEESEEDSIIEEE